MSDLHHEFERAAALAADSAPCWFCGAAAPARSDDLPPQCSDVAACFARSVSPPPGPASVFADDGDGRVNGARENSTPTAMAMRVEWDRTGRIV